MSSGGICETGKPVLYAQQKDGSCWIKANYDAADSGTGFISVYDNNNNAKGKMLHSQSFSLKAANPLKTPISSIVIENIASAKDYLFAPNPNIRIQLSVKQMK
jgi:hypothetical protein